MRICQTGVVVEILCACFGCPLHGKSLRAIRRAALAGRTAFRLSYVKYSMGANKTTRIVYRALGKPDSTAARRAFLEGRAIGEWHAESKCLFCASALFRPQRSFLPYLFCQDRKDMARGAAVTARRIPPRLRRIRMQKYDCRRQKLCTSPLGWIFPSGTAP